MMWQRAAGDPWPAGVAADVKSDSIIEFSGPNNPKIDTHNNIYLSSFLNFGVTAGDLWPAGRSADGKSNVTIEISGPKNPKIETHIDISVIVIEFWCDGGRRMTFHRRAGRRT